MRRWARAALVCGGAAALPAWAGDFDCLIDAAQVVEVRSSVDGVIAQVHAKRGDTIRRGQPLVELQSGAERAAVEAARYRAKMVGPIQSARHRVDYTGAKLARLTQMQAENYVSAQQRDEARAERLLAEAELATASENQDLARLELRRAEEQLALRTIAAPFNGVVLDRLLNPGDLAESGAGRKPVLKIAQIDPLKVDIVVPAALFGSVRLGAPVSVSPRGVPGRHTGTVTMIDKMIDTASATFVVRLELPNPQHAIPGGVRCSADIDGVKPAAAPALPQRPAARPAP